MRDLVEAAGAAGPAAAAGGLRGLWERASNLGVRADQLLEERRLIRLCNQSGLIGAVTCFGFSILYLAAGAATFWRGIAFNTGDGLLLLSVLLHNHRGRHAFARVLFLLVANLHILAVSVLLGPAVGFQYYYFPFIAAAFLVLPSTRRGQLVLFPLMSFALFAYVNYGLTPADASIAIPEPLARIANMVSTALTGVTLAFVVHLFASDTVRAEALLEKEHERSERLLLNVLPPSISARLKSGNELIADGFDEASVLFGDIVGFTELSGRLPVEELAGLLNRVFSRFDDLAERHGLEKIKTIGDAYMVASGLPVPRADHAVVLADMALDMRDALAAVARDLTYPLQIRIGIHAGPVVAGVIGKRKFIYDLWGDTVNTASRMESHGVPGEIQISEAMKALLGGAFELESRGEIQVKGKGAMVTYLLKGRVRRASE